MDVVECQDTDAARELLAWSELGLCAPGEQARILADGDASVGGRRPVNPSGRAAVQGRTTGCVGLGPGGRAGSPAAGNGRRAAGRGARVGLAHVIGRGANACVTVLTR